MLEFWLDADERAQYLKYVKLIEEQTSKVFYNKLTYVFLELVTFAKSEVPAFMKKGVFSKVFIKSSSSAPLTIAPLLIALEGLVDPHQYFLVNRNYLVHWSAISRWEDEENGRHVKVWLKPPLCLPVADGEETFEYVSKEKAAPFRRGIPSYTHSNLFLPALGDII